MNETEKQRIRANTYRQRALALAKRSRQQRRLGWNLLFHAEQAQRKAAEIEVELLRIKVQTNRAEFMFRVCLLILICGLFLLGLWFVL